MAIQSVQIQSYFWSHFESLRIQSECGKIRTRNNSLFGNFSFSYMIINVLDTMKKVPGNEKEFN